MSLLDTYRINKAIAVLLSARDAESADVVQATAKLKQIGPSAIPKLIEALGKAVHLEPVVALLVPLVHNATLPLFSNGLASSNTRVVAGTVEILTHSTTYDPHLLLDYFVDTRIAKAALGKILLFHKDKLRLQPILKAIEHTPPEGRAVLVSLVRQLATADDVPDMIEATTNPDASVRLGLVQTLMRFRTEAVRDAFLHLLTDPHAPIREAALEGLTILRLPCAVEPVCQLLSDPDRSVRRQALILLAQRRDPQTVPYLFEVLQHAPPDVERGVIELFNVLGDPGTIHNMVDAHPDRATLQPSFMRLLQAQHVRVRQIALAGLLRLQLPLDIEPIYKLLWDPDRTIRHQAATILAQINDLEHTVPALIEALQDEAFDVRQSAVEVLNVLATADLLKEILLALRDKEWWSNARVTEALSGHGSTKIIAAIAQLITDADDYIRQSAVDIIKQMQGTQVFDTLVDILHNGTPWAQTCAAEALAALGDKRAVPVLLRMAEDHCNTDVRLVAMRTLAACGDSRAIAPLLAQMHAEDLTVRQEAIRALGGLTDAEHAGAVLQAVMAVRETTDQTVKDAANTTASLIIRKFGERAIGGSAIGGHTPADMSMAGSQSLMLPAASGAGPQTAPPRPATGVHPAAGPSSAANRSNAAPRSSGSQPADEIINTSTLEPGTVLADRYRIIRRIGAGGFGTVFLAEDMVVREQLILKFLNPQMAADERMIQRFIHELRYARRVSHENVIRIHDFLTLGKSYAISMEYFASHSLAQELAKRQGPLEMQRSLNIIYDVSRGMQAAHQAKIIHRDLKPPNILINDAGVVKVVDFGLAAAASALETRLTKTGAILGTPLYMAPEQVQNRNIDARADIYSLGVVMYEVFTGTPPYTGDSPLSILFQHVEGKVTPPRQHNPEISPELEAQILQAMAVDPEQRFPSMEALSKSLEGLIS